ncbi:MULTISPECIES: PspC domain-containing protein [Nocardiopsis]|uniref:PspC domain-containing protein n=1 Tax=Nocardiopsis changdeensis TaxID=2831969 RepID=A0ABX8BIM3_9ACTN|nr:MULTISPECIES: PspC domain-containing protein [Nocardiopsis]QUX22065.1 PspC domain-containing protein [Nocardiopsis changdeensis]QYX38003.1 PspC domain-containing protein [Nocardiopsis sp. MT53]
MSEDSAPTGSDAPAAGTVPVPERELRKADDDRVLAGVCSGLGRYTRTDPVVWRAAFALTSFAGGTGLLLYLVAWMLMRDARGGPATIEQMLNRSIPPRTVLKLLAVGLAVATAFSLVGGFGWSTLVLAVPLVLGVLAARGRGVDLRSAFTGLGEELRAKAPPPETPVAGPSPSYYNPAQPWASAPTGPVDLAVVAERTMGGDRSDGGDGDEGPGDGDHDGGDRGPGRDRGKAKPRRGAPLAVLALWTLLAVAVVAPVAAFGGDSSVWSADTARLLLGPETGVYFLAGALGLVGLLAVVGTWAGNPRGLGFLGLVLTLGLVLVSVVDVTRVRIGEDVWRPTTVAQAEAGGAPRFTVGDLTVDLTAIGDLEPGETVDVRAGIGRGRLVLLLPEEARARVRADVGLGSLVPLGGNGEKEEQFGITRELSEVFEPVGGAGDDEVPLIRVDTDIRVGTVEVRHGEA